RPEAHGTLAAGQRHHVLFGQPGEYGSSCLRVREVERDHQAAPAHVAHLRVAARDLVQTLQQPATGLGGAPDVVVTLDDLEQPPGADHVDQAASPGRVDPPGDVEDVVGDVV